MKKCISYFICSAIIAALFSGCADLTLQKKSDTVSMPVTLVSISSDDLGRVLVFTHNIDNVPLVFIKNFYSTSLKRKEIKRDMKRYAATLSGLIGELVLVTFYENGVGDRIIVAIAKDKY